jgi:uncharacterized protein YndB with AHSA1/START domain
MADEQSSHDPIGDHPGGDPAGDQSDQSDRVTRAVELGAGVDEVWEAVADPALRALWLDDPDTRARTVDVAEVDPGRRLTWTWSQPEGGDPVPSTVEIALRPLDGGGTRVVVTETRAAPAPVVTASASASASAPTARARRRAWDRRLLGLELLFVAAGALVS